MSKIEPLTPILSTYTGTAKLNAHLDKIEAALDNTLSRDGSAPNEMEADINLNDNQLINVGEPLLDHNVATKRYVDDLVSGTGTYIIATSALGTGWGNVLASPQTDSGPATATSYGFLATGLTATSAANKTALQAALDANYWVILPPGTGYTNGITHTRTNRLSGCGPATILFLGNSANSRMFTAVSKTDMIYEDFVINMNYANNTGSGAHDGIRIETCNNPSIRRVKVIGAQGLFSGSKVGGGVSVTGGEGGIFEQVYLEECYDGLVLFQHNYFWTDKCRASLCIRAGMLYDDCDDWVDNNTYAVLCGTDVTLDGACAGVLVQNCARWVSNSPECKDSTYGYGFQIQIGCVDWVLNAPRVKDNAWDGVGITAGVTVNYCLRGRIVGGYGVNNRASNLTISDGSADITVVGFVDGGGSPQGINVFRSTAHLVGCYGSVTVWDAGTVNTLAIGAAGAAYTNGTYTGIPLVGPTWYVDGLGRSSLTANITVAGGVVTVATINFIGNMALPPTSLTGLTAPTLPGGAGALFTITLVGASSNTCQGTTVSDGHQGGTLRVQAGSITYLPVKSCGFTTITDPTYTVSNTAIPASLQNSWVVDTRAVYYKDADGIVHIEGRIKNGTVAANTLLFTLPAGFMPAHTEYFLVTRNAGTANIYIETDGEVRDLGGTLNATWSSLNGIRFRAV